MWIENEIYLNDLNSIINDRNIEWDSLKGKSIMITGATGLIGTLTVNTLLYLNKTMGLNVNVLALVRNEEKAKQIFREQLKDNLNLKLIVNDICKKIECSEKVDYIIHAASQTSSKMFIEEPVETINVIYGGTKNVLEFAKNKQVKQFLFLSTMEVYGRPLNDEKIDENYQARLNTMETRNCYPIAKQLTENLCASYSDEYGINVKILRLTQTFGPGVGYDDGRVFAEFARCAIENRDIVLHTLGETKRNYVYTADAIRAIFTIMIKGENKEAYNVANENTYCSILEMAKMVANKCTGDRIKVKCEIESDMNKYGYAPTLKMNLDTRKIQKLGWKANVNLENMFKNMIKTIREI